MTREDMAKRLDYIASIRRHDNSDEDGADALLAAAAELRKTCAGCKHHTDGECRVRETYWDAVPSNGYCHRYEVK